MPIAPKLIGPAGDAPQAGGASPGVQSDRQRLEELLVESLPVVEQAVRVVAQRYRLTHHDAEDLASDARVAMMANDYEALAQFQGRSSLKTYLVTLVQRLFIDRQRRVSGKWRASTEALRLGPVAVRLELLLMRDEMAFSEAVERLRVELEVKETDDELAVIAGRLPPRFRARALVDSDAALQLAAASAAGNPETIVGSARVASAIQSGLSEALRTLDPDDRIILRMRYERGLTLADVARSLGLDQKQVYRRMEKAVARTRDYLGAAGLGWQDAERAIEAGHSDLRFSTIFGERGETRDAGPSSSEVQS